MAFPLSPSPNATPFIPPLHTPGARTPPAPAPVLPPSSNSGGPSWGHNTPYQRSRPSLFPTAHSPAGTPYIPPGSGPQLMPPPPGHPPGPHGPPPIPMMPGGGGYFHQTPHTGQSGAHQPLPQVSAEWVGFGQTPASAPHTPYTPAGPPPPHGGAHFGPPPHQGYGSPYYGPPPPPPGPPQTPYHHPGMGMPMGMGGMGGPPPSGWGPAGATPYHQPAYMQWNAAPSPWMGPPGGPGGGGPMYPPPGMGMGMGPGDGFFGGAPQPPASLARATVHVGDRVPPFTPGKHYGPALEPTLIKVLKVDVQLNPLLTFPDISTTPDDAFTTLKYLKWNMLFESSYCQLSTDAPNASWSTGRNDPATWPKLTSLKVTFHPRHSLPWTWVIKPKNPNHCLWVTCGDVIDGISAYIQRPSSGAEYSMLPLPRQRGVSEAYRKNRMVGHDVPGGRLGEGLRKLDWLGDEHIFGGLERPDTSVGEGGVMLPCTFVIRLERNYVLERGEGGPGAQAQAQRERERDGREGVIPRVVPE